MAQLAPDFPFRLREGRGDEARKAQPGCSSCHSGREPGPRTTDSGQGHGPSPSLQGGRPEKEGQLPTEALKNTCSATQATLGFSRKDP